MNEDKDLSPPEFGSVCRRFVERAQERCRSGSVGSVTVDMGEGRIFTVDADGLSAAAQPQETRDE